MDWKRPPRARRAILLVEHLEDRTVPTVFTPSQIATAYGFNQITFSTPKGTIVGTGAGQTIAIVDAYSDPNIASDLQAFDKSFGIPAPPSLSIVQQSGTVANSQWASEISLDVEWAHAMAPGARIVLGEARSDSLSDLVSEVDTVADMPGVSVVSMSWNASEWASESAFDNNFKTPAGHQGVTYVASSGDNGATTSWPASSPNVLSVGGTALSINSKGAYAGETGWSGSGGGVSPYEAKPAYQNLVSTGMSMRSTPDVSYDASPSSGFYVYDSYYNSGWIEVGGTSAGAPQWAALIAIADQGRVAEGKSTLDGATQTLYAIYRMAQSSQSTYFHDVTSGNNGTSDKSGFDEVTGNGSPISYMIAAGLVAWNGYGVSGNVSPSGENAVPAYAKAVSKPNDDVISLSAQPISSGTTQYLAPSSRQASATTGTTPTFATPAVVVLNSSLSGLMTSQSQAAAAASLNTQFASAADSSAPVASQNLNLPGSADLEWGTALDSVYLNSDDWFSIPVSGSEVTTSDSGGGEGDE